MVLLSCGFPKQFTAFTYNGFVDEMLRSQERTSFPKSALVHRNVTSSMIFSKYITHFGIFVTPLPSAAVGGAA
jgi:hypothetical protein